MSDYNHLTQGCRHVAKRGLLVLLVMLCGLGLAGCGKKASRLDPPDTVVDDTFPQTYPNTDLDPKPTLNPQTNATLRIAPTVATPTPSPAAQPSP